MNKKAQLDSPIVWFIVIVFGLLLIAPITLKMFNAIKTPVANSLNQTGVGGGDIASGNFSFVMNTFTTFWDKVIVATFFLALILLFVSAFMIDTSPFWVILYIFINFMLILFAPGIISSLDAIYASPDFAVEVSQLTFMSFILSHFGELLVGIMVITGIIIYAKISLTRR